jgi:hypothetical protein
MTCFRHPRAGVRSALGVTWRLVTGLSQVQTLTSWHTSARSLTTGASMWASRLAGQIVWCESNDVLTCAWGLGRVSAEDNKGNTEMTPRQILAVSRLTNDYDFGGWQCVGGNGDAQVLAGLVKQGLAQRNINSGQSRGEPRWTETRYRLTQEGKNAFHKKN